MGFLLGITDLPVSANKTALSIFIKKSFPNLSMAFNRILSLLVQGLAFLVLHLHMTVLLGVVIYVPASRYTVSAQDSPCQLATPLSVNDHACPLSAVSQCTGNGEPWWCCPSGSSCAWDEKGDPCCCPAGQSCSSTISPQGPVTTVSSALATRTSGTAAVSSTSGDDGACGACPTIEIAVSAAATRSGQFTWDICGSATVTVALAIAAFAEV